VVFAIHIGSCQYDTLECRYRELVVSHVEDDFEFFVSTYPITQYVLLNANVMQFSANKRRVLLSETDQFAIEL
jgi:hypothetical protein